MHAATSASDQRQPKRLAIAGAITARQHSAERNAGLLQRKEQVAPARWREPHEQMRCGWREQAVAQPQKDGRREKERDVRPRRDRASAGEERQSDLLDPACAPARAQVSAEREREEHRCRKQADLIADHRRGNAVACSDGGRDRRQRHRRHRAERLPAQHGGKQKQELTRSGVRACVLHGCVHHVGLRAIGADALMARRLSSAPTHTSSTINHVEASWQARTAGDSSARGVSRTIASFRASRRSRATSSSP